MRASIEDNQGLYRADGEGRMHPASLQNRLCHTAEEMEMYCKGSLPSSRRAAVAHHLHGEGCERCRQLYRIVKGSLKDRSETTCPRTASPNPSKKSTAMDRSGLLARLKKKRFPSSTPPTPITATTRVNSGEIWSTACRPRTLQGRPLDRVEGTIPVLIVDAGSGEKSLSNIIRVMPLSLDIGHLQQSSDATLLSTDGEGATLLLPASPSSPGGFPFLVEIFNERAMLAGNLAAFLEKISMEKMNRIETLRERWRSGHEEEDRPELRLASLSTDPETRAWMKREIALCDYLSLPVEMSYKEKDPWISFHCRPYKKAAHNGMPVRDEITEVLMQTDEAVLALLQREDRLMLRLYLNEPVDPVTVTLDGEAVTMIPTTAKDVQEAEIGRVGHLPDTMAIGLHLTDEEAPFTFSVKLISDHHQHSH